LKPHNALGKQRAFDYFCKKVIKNEVRDFFNELNKNRETPFSELSARETEQLYTTDKYFAAEQIFTVLGQEIIVNSERVAEALRNLPEKKRDIIILAYFLDMTDREIGEKLNLIRNTVQYQRKSTLQLLKKMMKEGQDYE
jgi:RNA polymerase sigma factor (sigma-70 family)